MTIMPSLRQMRFLLLLVSIILVVFSAKGVRAATKTWDGGGANTNWTTPGNWVGDVAPVAGDDLVFPDGALQQSNNNNFTFFTSFHSITISGGAYTVGGNPFILSSAFTASGGTHAINTAIALGGPITMTAEGAAVVTILSVSNLSFLVTIDGTGTFVFGPVSGSGGLTKRGTGITDLFTNNSYTGATTVENGILVVEGSQPNSVVNVTGGGIGGTGTVGRVNVATGGGIGAGSLTAQTAIFNIQGNLTLAPGGAVLIKAQGNVAGTGYDQLNVTGTVDLAGCDLAPVLISTYVPAVGDTFRIINNDGTDAVVGTFNGIAEGAVVALLPGLNFRVTYHGGTGNDVEVKRVAQAPYDFDGDGKSDVSVFRPSEGAWYLLRSTAGFSATPFGAAGDVTTAADYDGDGIADIALFRPSTGGWYRLSSTTGAFVAVIFGQNGDLPVPADFDGDAKADIAVFRPSDGYWYYLRSSDNSFVAQPFGNPADRPVPGDYDGDGRADITVFRPADGVWHILQSSNGAYSPRQFGANGDVPTPADFDGDGKTDTAVFRSGTWYVLNSGANTVTGVAFGVGSDTPAPADYDGDGKADIAVFRSGNWYILTSANGGFLAQPFGSAGDIPVPGR